VDTFATYFAPADFNETVNTLGQPLYAKQEPRKFDRGTDLHTQSNQIIGSLLPALNDMAGGMVESAKEGGTLRVILDGVVLVLKTLALGAATVGKAFVALGEAIGAGVPVMAFSAGRTKPLGRCHAGSACRVRPEFGSAV